MFNSKDFRLDEMEPLSWFSDDEEAMKRPLIPADEFNLPPGSYEYKQARKKRQNRESATRSRLRKQKELKFTSSKLEKMIKMNEELRAENARLEAENEALRKKVKDFENPKGKRKRKSGKQPNLLVTTVAVALTGVLNIESNQDIQTGPHLGHRGPKSLTESCELNLQNTLALFILFLSVIFQLFLLVKVKLTK